MANKQKKLLNDKKLREIKVSDSLTNLEEFTRVMTDNIDFNCFDVLSVTRIDSETTYTKKYAHPHVEAQVHRLDSDVSESIPIEIAKNKLN